MRKRRREPALADVDGHVASDKFFHRPRQHMCRADSGFGQFERWEWIWTLLKRSRCTVRFPLIEMIKLFHRRYFKTLETDFFRINVKSQCQSIDFD